MNETRKRAWPVAMGGLAARLILILTIALLPLGMMSVYQTSKVVKDRIDLSKADLLQRTTQAASRERELIQSAIGAAEALGAAFSGFSNEDVCDELLAHLVAAEPDYIFAGVFDEAGRPICSSEAKEKAAVSDFRLDPYDLSDEPTAHIRNLSIIGGKTGLVITVPMLSRNGPVENLKGYVAIALPFTLANTLLAEARLPVDLVAFDQQGEILATETFGDDRRAVLPENHKLKELQNWESRVFRDVNYKRQKRIFAVVPIVEGRLFVLGSWEPNGLNTNAIANNEALALYFPFIMWAVSAIVAYFGINFQVLKHVRQLRRWMRQYANGTLRADEIRLDHASQELTEVAAAFRDMVHLVSDNKRQREEDIKEKTVLLREVHHRVKNNLQLISSIMNMQIRNARTTESRLLLRRVQDRVMALSAIHRYLYTADRLSMVRADKLLDDIIKQFVVIGNADVEGGKIDFSTDISPVSITPDQSVPLSLLVTEAAINAVKYCGVDANGRSWINIMLHEDGQGSVCLSVVNSKSASETATRAGEVTDGAASDAADDMHSGLGSKLIESFVSQLEGRLEVKELQDRFELHVTFALSNLQGEIEANDYP